MGTAVKNNGVHSMCTATQYKSKKKTKHSIEWMHTHNQEPDARRLVLQLLVAGDAVVHLSDQGCLDITETSHQGHTMDMVDD